MKLIFVQYLASLKERGELDVIIPDLLSEIGFTVVSRPATGTRQYGVDVVAVGEDAEGVRKLYLLSIKPGNLRRYDWDDGPQSLRASLNEILDVYIRTQVPSQYAKLPVCIVLCLGGDLHEDVRANVVGFIEKNSRARIAFEIWNGDRLAELLLQGVLREKALPETWQSDFRKSVALVDEPDVGFRHFCRFLSGIADVCGSSTSARLTAIRQIHLGLWTLYVWARDAGSIEAAYLSSERALLVSWPLVRDHLGRKTKPARQLTGTVERLISLHNTIEVDYLASYVEPRARVMHGVISAVPSQASLDVNLRLFDILGRVATRGLWQLRDLGSLDPQENPDRTDIVREQLQDTATLLADIVRTNPILCTPIKDSQAIDINIACVFLNRLGHNHIVQPWIHQIVRATVFAYQTNSKYPCVFEDYHELVDHPKKDTGYRAKATAGSLLVPTLAVWAAVTDDKETLGVLADFVAGPYRHATLQLWYPGPDTEEHLYANTDKHGLADIHVKIERDCHGMLAPIRAESAASAAFLSLSPLKYGLWPLLAVASRHYRVPLPPQFWPFSVGASENP